MLILPCPVCGPRDHSEFDHRGDASAPWPALDAPPEEWAEAVFERANPRGPHVEHWLHARGCGCVIEVTRDTLTHQIAGARLAHPGWRAALEGAP